jgi:hypothetical protein
MFAASRTAPIRFMHYSDAERTPDLRLFIPQKRGLKQSRLLTVTSSPGYMANIDSYGTCLESARTHISNILNETAGAFRANCPLLESNAQQA